MTIASALSPTTLLVATSNPGKLKEFQAMLDSSRYTLIPQDAQHIPPAEETGLTFIENALIKARAACLASGLPSLADDSGLVVPALGGAPGIYSARFAGKNATDQENREKLLTQIQSVPMSQRQAFFYCAIVLVQSPNDPTPVIAQAAWHGVIANEPQGENGFGYDRIFYIPSLNCTAAELSPEEKNKLSHRAQALKHLKTCLKGL